LSGNSINQCGNNYQQQQCIPQYNYNDRSCSTSPVGSLHDIYSSSTQQPSSNCCKNITCETVCYERPRSTSPYQSDNCDCIQCIPQQQQHQQQCCSSLVCSPKKKISCAKKLCNRSNNNNNKYQLSSPSSSLMSQCRPRSQSTMSLTSTSPLNIPCYAQQTNFINDPCSITPAECGSIDGGLQNNTNYSTHGQYQLPMMQPIQLPSVPLIPQQQQQRQCIPVKCTPITLPQPQPQPPSTPTPSHYRQSRSPLSKNPNDPKIYEIRKEKVFIRTEPCCDQFGSSNSTNSKYNNCQRRCHSSDRYLDNNSCNNTIYRGAYDFKKMPQSIIKNTTNSPKKLLRFDDCKDYEKCVDRCRQKLDNNKQNKQQRYRSSSSVNNYNDDDNCDEQKQQQQSKYKYATSSSSSSSSSSCPSSSPSTAIPQISASNDIIYVPMVRDEFIKRESCKLNLLNNNTNYKQHYQQQQHQQNEDSGIIRF
jgi:hypothetical protein